MSEIKTFFNAMVQELREQRSDLEKFVRDDVNEVRTDLRHIWTRLDEQWDSLQDRNTKMQAMTGEAAEDMRQGVQSLLLELQEGYRQLRKTLSTATKPAPPPKPARKKRAGPPSHDTRAHH